MASPDVSFLFLIVCKKKINDMLVFPKIRLKKGEENILDLDRCLRRSRESHRKWDVCPKLLVKSLAAYFQKLMLNSLED